MTYEHKPHWKLNPVFHKYRPYFFWWNVSGSRASCQKQPVSISRQLHPAFLICPTSPRSTALQARKWGWNKRSIGSTAGCVSDLGDKTSRGCSRLQPPRDPSQETARGLEWEPPIISFHAGRCPSLATCHSRGKRQRWQKLSVRDYHSSPDWFPLSAAQKIG